MSQSLAVQPVSTCVLYHSGTAGNVPCSLITLVSALVTEPLTSCLPAIEDKGEECGDGP